MKKTVITVATLLLSLGAFAQAPQKLSYQAVIRNVNQSLAANQTVSTRISILQSWANGVPVYVEEHYGTTNVNGLLSLEIGGGDAVSGDFSAINWANGPYYIKTETDPQGGSNFSITGISQMASVPYALYAESSGTPGPAGPTGPAGISAYQLWLDNGNSGTESDFLASLVGPQGQAGQTGAMGPMGPQGPAGVQGPIGANGLNAYEIWVDAGNSGSPTDFLNSLIGATGPMGPQGPAGADGVDGATGPMGPQGPAGANGADGATGPMGPQGPAGADGATGPQGPAGADGANGADGVNGLSAYEIWINAGNSGTESFFLNSLIGATGPQGPQGPAGADGATGPQGPVGADGQSAYEVWINAGNSGTEADFLNSLVGATGPAGPAGDAGATGPQGPTGATGPQGPAGPIAGVNKQINFNDNGSAGADAELLYDKSSNHMAIGTSSMNPSAALEINSTTGSLLMPRMTTAQRDALTGTDGMVIFNTSLKKLQLFLAGGSFSEGNPVGVSFGYSDNAQGNTFEIANTANLGTISVSIANPAGNPITGTTVYTMKIYDSQGGSLLATSSNTFSASPGGYTGGAFDFSSSSLQLTGNTPYYFEVSSDNGSNFYLYASYSNNYTLGSMYVNGAFNATADIRFTVTSSSPDEWVDLH